MVVSWVSAADDHEANGDLTEEDLIVSSWKRRFHGYDPLMLLGCVGHDGTGFPLGSLTRTNQD